MEEIAAFTSDWQQLQSANKCRLYLYAMFLSDISDGSGHFLLDAAWTGSQRLNDHRQSLWPNQGKPSELDWDIWQSLLHSTVLARGRNLRKDLGDWLGMDPHWQWYYCPDDNRLYQKLMQRWQCFSCIIDRPKWSAFSTTPQYTAPQSTL
jgi:hypothetical protein